MFYKGSMQYTKQAMDFDCQLHILKERGLTVENEEDALKFLHSVSYFRFANYLQPMSKAQSLISFYQIAVLLLLQNYMFLTENCALWFLPQSKI